MSFKKILIVTSEFPPQPGGIGNHAYHLALNLTKQGYNLTVLCDTREISDDEELQFDQLQPFSIIRTKRRPLIFLTYLKRLVNYKQQIKQVDMVIATGKFPLWLVGLTNSYGRKSIAVIHGSEVNFKDVKRNIVNAALKRFDNIIAVSNHTKSLVSDLNLKNITVIPNGFYLEKNKFKVKSNASNSIRLVTVGNITERKGQINIIKALPKLIGRFSNIEYHMVGLPTEQSKLETLATQLSVENHIKFHGRLSENDKQETLKNSDIFVMLSNITSTGDTEGFGIAIIEANALGLPAIGSKNTGIEDAISDDFSGKLIDPLNREELIAAVEAIINNYTVYSNNSIAWSTNFDWKKIIKKYIDIIE